MKEFNLEEALAGKPVVTRDGRKVSELHLFETTYDKQQLVAIIDKNAYAYYRSGKRYNEYDAEHNNDLFMAPETVTKWVNVYKSEHRSEVYTGESLYENEDDAKKNCIMGAKYITTTSVTFEI